MTLKEFLDSHARLFQQSINGARQFIFASGHVSDATIKKNVASLFSKIISRRYQDDVIIVDSPENLKTTMWGIAHEKLDVSMDYNEIEDYMFRNMSSLFHEEYVELPTEIRRTLFAINEISSCLVPVINYASPSVVSFRKNVELVSSLVLCHMIVMCGRKRTQNIASPKIHFDDVKDILKLFHRATLSCLAFHATAGKIFAVRLPTEIHRKGDVIHADLKKALIFRDGWGLYFLNGIRVPDWLAITPAKKLEPEKIFDITNADIRREFVTKVGLERIIRKLSDGPIDKFGNYELHHLKLWKSGRRRPFLLMKNPSVSDAWHIEGVHPSIRTVDEALNWRNGLHRDTIDNKNGEKYYQQGDVLIFPEGATKFKSRPIILT